MSTHSPDGLGDGGGFKKMLIDSRRVGRKSEAEMVGQRLLVEMDPLAVRMNPVECED